MKLKYLLNPNDPIIEELSKLGIENDNNSEYVISRQNVSLKYINAKSGEQIFFIPTNEIIFIESIGRDVIIHTNVGDYTTKERIKQLEIILDQDKFLRVSNSSIVSIKRIRKIEASFFQKFILHMSNGALVDVTRTYYYIFKERFHI